MAAEIIGTSTNPSGTMQAIIERDERTVYLYLRHHEGAMLSCWLRNLTTAPAELDVSAMEDGNAPMLPAKFCAHPEGAPIDPDKLKIVWLEEENGAGVYEDGELLAVCPAWATGDPCPGFARDSLDHNPVVWPLGSPEMNALHGRMAKADAFWREWDDEETPWMRIQPLQLDTYAKIFGMKESRYLAIDGGAWPPKAMAQYNLADRTILVTVGLALRPQPGAELIVNADEVRRGELGICLPGKPTDEAVDKVGRYLSSVTSIPWANNTWIGEGHTIGCNVWPGRAETINLRWTYNAAGLPTIELPEFRGDTVDVLWGVPNDEPKKSWVKSLFRRG